jgi:hypothetical protein
LAASCQKAPPFPGESQVIHLHGSSIHPRPINPRHAGVVITAAVAVLYSLHRAVLYSRFYTAVVSVLYCCSRGFILILPSRVCLYCCRRSIGGRLREDSRKIQGRFRGALRVSGKHSWNAERPAALRWSSTERLLLHICRFRSDKVSDTERELKLVQKTKDKDFPASESLPSHRPWGRRRQRRDAHYASHIYT